MPASRYLDAKESGEQSCGKLAQNQEQKENICERQ
jgi:hypothetical protein